MVTDSRRVTCWRGRNVRFAYLEEGDAELIHRWQSDPLIAHEAGFLPRALSACRERIQRDIDNQSRDDFLVLLEDGTPIGHIALIEQEYVDGWGEVCLVLDPAWRGQGYGTDAVDALVDFALGELPLYRVEAFTHVTNAAALGALAKSGFVQEGVRRGACAHRGSRHDLAALSLLRPEWEALTRPRAWDHG